MKNRKITLSVALAILVSSSVSIAQQGAKKKTATATEGGASIRVEPLRVIGGELHGRTVNGQVTQDTARKTPPAPGEKTEQTQSLYAQSEASTSCGVMFLKLTLPRRLRARMGTIAEPLQLGVVLKPFDNERGEEIVKHVCQLL